MAPEFSGRGDPHRTLRLLWRRGERPARGPKATLTVDAIVEAAVRLADAEGLAAVSMRRLASELGVGAMSLYRHVPGKDELVDLMVDRVVGESPVAGPEVVGWRARLEHHARAGMAHHRAHPWTLDVSLTRPPLGPNVMSRWEAMLAAAAETGLPVGEWSSVAVTVSSFVEGTAHWLVREGQAQQATGLTADEWWSAREVFWETYFVPDDHPTITHVYTQGGFDDEADPFEYGLQRVLDGIAARIAAHEAG